MWLIRITGLFIGCLLGSTAIAGNVECSGIGLREAYSSLDIHGAKACFVYTMASTENEEKHSRDPNGISLYSVTLSNNPKLVYEFPYAGTKGEIAEAFFLPVAGVDEKTLFLIHRMEAPRSWDSVSDIYNVSVLRWEGEALLLDQKRTRFFDLGGDTVDEQGRLTFAYPYKDKKSVEAAISSPLFYTIIANKRITGTILEKTFLHDGDSEPLPQNSSKMYLIKGDRVLVEDSMAGWCRVSYQAKVKIIKKWAQCKSINFSAS
jgi:hypothetical protein